MMLIVSWLLFETYKTSEVLEIKTSVKFNEVFLILGQNKNKSMVDKDKTWPLAVLLVKDK